MSRNICMFLYKQFRLLFILYTFFNTGLFIPNPPPILYERSHNYDWSIDQYEDEKKAWKQTN